VTDRIDDNHGNGSIRLLLTAGDPNGVGPEVLVKALAELHPFDDWTGEIVGNLNSIRSAVEELGVPDISAPGIELLLFGTNVSIVDIGGTFSRQAGSLDAAAGRISAQSVIRSVEKVLAGHADGIVTMPISKEAWELGGYEWPGHTEMISSMCGVKEGLMILMCRSIRVALLTGHIPLSSVSAAIDQKRIEEKIRTFSASLREDFGIRTPRIALLGLNPHAGDGGVLGNEEATVYHEAVRRLLESGIYVDGPFPADAFFARRRFRDYDGVMASYHDQGLIPIKLLAEGDGVNFTAGLPIVRTSPDHGTAFDIAGTGHASADSAVSAIRRAIEIIRSRPTLTGVSRTDT
jgi:4-hydroxythreonine-4-phosphate dehydrogenase